MSEYSRIQSKVVQIIVRVDRVEFSQVKELLQSLVDEDDADECSEGLLCETGDVADKGASICGH